MDALDRDHMLLARKQHRRYLEQACDPGYIDPPLEEPPVITNYIELAMRTNSTATGQSKAVSPDLLHATLGLCSEHFEYNAATGWLNAVEELGDTCWFIALAANDLGVDPFHNWETLLDNDLGAPLLTVALSEFVDLVKRAYAYDAPLDTARLNYLLCVMVARIGTIAQSKAKRSLDDLLMANIEKLAARFPDKFTQNAALFRTIKNESAAMKQVLH